MYALHAVFARLSYHHHTFPTRRRDTGTYNTDELYIHLVMGTPVSLKVPLDRLYIRLSATLNHRTDGHNRDSRYYLLYVVIPTTCLSLDTYLPTHTINDSPVVSTETRNDTY